MEAAWVTAWFQRVLAEAEADPNRVLIADRSPMSAAFYTRDGKGTLLQPLIRSMYADLLDAGIEVYTVYLKVQETVLWERIQRRLLVEPDRAFYKEDSKEWMLRVVDFYESFDGWDFVIDNSVDDKASALSDVMAEVIQRVGSRSPRFKDHVSRKRRVTAANACAYERLADVASEKLSLSPTAPLPPSLVLNRTSPSRSPQHQPQQRHQLQNSSADGADPLPPPPVSC